MNTTQPFKALWWVLIVAGLSLALIALIGQTVTARPGGSDLQPPFRFVERSMSTLAHTLPPGSKIIFTETFGASFAPVTTLVGSTPQWRIIRNPGDSAGYYWDKVGAGTPITFANSAWSAARVATATQVLTAGLSSYPAGQDTWLIYGPIDLSAFTYAQLNFGYYLDSREGDTLLWGYSTDGQTFYGNEQSGPLNQWITNTYSFKADASFRSVYVAFAFNSQSSGGLGPFVRRVELTAEPLKLSYLPALMNNYTPPTPTPMPPLYGPYTFDVDNNDLDHWGGAYSGVGSGSGGSYGYGQFVRTNPPHGDPGKSLTLYNGAYWVMTASSPNTDELPNDFELSVDVSPWVIYPRNAGCQPACPPDNLGNMYGVIFNASAGTFGANPSQFNWQGQYYMVFFYNIDATKPIGMKLRRCSGGSCTTLQTTSLPAGLVYGNSAYWDNIVIRRTGANINVSVNGTSLVNVTDSTYVNGRYGMFIFPSDGNYTAYPVDLNYAMQVDFDNIQVDEP
jgi:hypothetical protein